jgi:hypothetical protein
VVHQERGGEEHLTFSSCDVGGEPRHGAGKVGEAGLEVGAEQEELVLHGEGKGLGRRRKGPSAGNKVTCNCTNKPHSKATQRKAKPNQTPQTHTRGPRQAEQVTIDLQRETEEKARQPETKLAAIAQTCHTARPGAPPR